MLHVHLDINNEKERLHLELCFSFVLSELHIHNTKLIIKL